MTLTEALVIERRPLTDRRTLLWLRAPELSRAARPGQFVMVRCGPGWDPFLSRPFWIHRLRDGDAGEELALLVESRGHGSALLAMSVPGQVVRLLGPLGRPLSIVRGARNLLLVGEGRRIAPLIWCADEETARGRDVALVLGGTTAADIYPLDLIGPEVECTVTTTDGSAGRQGGAVELLGDLSGWADQIVLSVDPARFPDALAVLRAQPWRRPVQALIETPMACGSGLCGGCPVEIRRGGRRLVCLDGPAFELRDLR